MGGVTFPLGVAKGKLTPSQVVSQAASEPVISPGSQLINRSPISQACNRSSSQSGWLATNQSSFQSISQSVDQWINLSIDESSEDSHQSIVRSLNEINHRTVWICWIYRCTSMLLCYYTILLTSTSPSEIAGYIVIWVYYYATILRYLPRLHRLKLLIISLSEYIFMLLYYYTYLYFTVWICWLYRYTSILLCYYTIILTSTSPSEIADYIVVLVYSYATTLSYLPLLHRLKLRLISLY